MTATRHEVMEMSAASVDLSQQSGDEKKPKPEAVRITVNEQFVVMADKHQTGASIKVAAIAAGVPLQPDFVLSEVHPNGEQNVVPDDKKVTLKEGDEFWAIPGDDNS